MESFKIEHFERDHPGEAFSPFHTLRSDEAKSIGATFSRKAGLENEGNPLTLLHQLIAKASPVFDFNPADDTLDLQAVLTQAGIRPARLGFIDWGRFDQVDRFDFPDLIAHFDDIWYNEDVSVFDETMSWILFIMHYGDVLVLRFNQ